MVAKLRLELLKRMDDDNAAVRLVACTALGHVVQAAIGTPGAAELLCFDVLEQHARLHLSDKDPGKSHFIHSRGPGAYHRHIRQSAEPPPECWQVCDRQRPSWCTTCIRLNIYRYLVFVATSATEASVAMAMATLWTYPDPWWL
jgi:hypothetical protein